MPLMTDPTRTLHLRDIAAIATTVLQLHRPDCPCPNTATARAILRAIADSNRTEATRIFEEQWGSDFTEAMRIFGQRP